MYAHRMTIDLLLREAGDFSTTAERLDELARHRSVSVREMVAGNPGLSAITAESLSRDPAWRVRAATAAHAGLVDSTLVSLGADEKDMVRWSAASHASGKPDVIVAFARSSDSRVRGRVAAMNHESPLARDLQVALAADTDAGIRSSIASSTGFRDIFDALLRDPDAETRGSCARNPRATREDVELLLTDRSRVTRRWAVAHGAIYPDDEQLIRMARDRSADVRWQVIFRVDAPREALRLVAEDTDEILRQHALTALDDGSVTSEQVKQAERARRAYAATVPGFV